MSTENQVDLTTVMEEYQKQWDPTASGSIRECINQKTFFPLSDSLFELGGDLNMNVDPETIPEEERETYNKFKQILGIKEKNPTTGQVIERSRITSEMGRGKNGGVNSLALLQYMVDHPNASLMDALNPTLDVDEKRKAGAKVLDLLIDCEKNPEKLGEALAAMANRISHFDYVDEYRKKLGLSADVSDEDFLAAMEKPENRLITLPLSETMRAFSISAHQAVTRCFAPVNMVFWDKSLIDSYSNNPGKKIYEAMYANMNDDDRMHYNRWAEAKNTIFQAMTLDYNNVSGLAKKSFPKPFPQYAVYNSLARMEMIKSRDVTAIEKNSLDFLRAYDHIENPNFLSDEETQAAIFQGISAKKAMELTGYLPKDHFGRVYFDCLTEKNISEFYKRFGDLGNSTGLATLGRISSSTSLVNLMMVVDGCDITNDILSNSKDAVALKKKYAKKYETFLQDNTVYVKNPDGTVSVNQQAVENFAALFMAGVDYCANFRFPDSIATDPNAQIDILHVASLFALDLSQSFSGDIEKLPEFQAIIGDEATQKKYSAILVDFQEIARSIAEESKDNALETRLVSKIKTDLIKNIIAGKSIDELHAQYPEGYLPMVMNVLHSNIFFDSDFNAGTVLPANRAQIEAFLNGGPLPSFMNNEKLRQLINQSCEMANSKVGNPKPEAAPLSLSEYTEQAKIDPTRDYACISAFVKQTDAMELTAQVSLAIFLDAMKHSNSKMTVEQAKAMYPEEFTEQLLQETMAKMQTALVEEMRSHNLNPEDPQVIAELKDCAAGGPLPSFLNKATVDAYMKTITSDAINNYNRIPGNHLSGVRPLVISNMADLLPSDSTDRLFFGITTNREANNLTDAFAKKEYTLYLPTLGREVSRASFVQLVMLAEGGETAEAVSLNTPEANEKKRTFGLSVKDKLLNHPPVRFAADGTAIPQTEDIVWYATVYQKSSNVILNLAIPEALDYSLPENAEKRDLIDNMATIAQDEVQIFRDNLRKIDAFKNVVGGELESINNKVGDFSSLCNVVTQWNSPKKAMGNQFADKVVLDVLGDSVCGKSMQEISKTYPDGYLYQLIASMRISLSDEFGRSCGNPANKAAMQEFFATGKLPDFIGREKLNNLIDAARIDAENVVAGKTAEMPKITPPDYTESPAAQNRREMNENLLSESLENMYSPTANPMDKLAARIALEAMGMSVDEACKKYSTEYVGQYLHSVETQFSSTFTELQEIMNSMDEAVALQQMDEFIKGGKLPFIFAGKEGKIREFIQGCATQAMNTVNAHNVSQMKRPMPLHFVDYESQLQPVEWRGLHFLGNEANNVDIPMDKNNESFLFDLDIKKINITSILDGSKIFDDMIKSDAFSFVRDAMSNPAMKAIGPEASNYFRIDGQTIDAFIDANVPNVAEYSAKERVILRKIGVMYALASGEHSIEVVHPGIDMGGKVTARLRSVEMDLSPFNDRKKWYQSTRESKAQKTKNRNASLFANREKRQKEISDRMQVRVDAARKCAFWDRLTPTVNSALSSYLPLDAALFAKLSNGSPVKLSDANEEQVDLYQRLGNLRNGHMMSAEGGKLMFEMFRGGCGGLGNMAMIQYLVDNPNATLCDSLNPSVDAAAKKLAGDKMLKLLENVEKDPKALGEALAGFAARLSKINLRDELVQALGLPADVSESVLKEKMLGEQRSEAIGFLAALSPIAVGMHQIIGKSFVSNSVAINDEEEIVPANPPAKEIYTAFFAARSPEDKKAYTAWNKMVAGYCIEIKNERNHQLSPYRSRLNGIDAEEPTKNDKIEKTTQDIFEAIIEGRKPAPKITNAPIAQAEPVTPEKAPASPEPAKAAPTNAPVVQAEPATPEQAPAARRRLSDTNSPAAQKLSTALSKGKPKKSADVGAQTANKDKTIQKPKS